MCKNIRFGLILLVFVFAACSQQAKNRDAKSALKINDQNWFAKEGDINAWQFTD